MRPTSQSPSQTAFLGLLAICPLAVLSLDLDLCADFNTADSSSGNYSIYQSAGLCHDFCLGDYAYAILNYQACWCSNYKPAQPDQVDVGSCDRACPGYPDEHCGGNDNLFGYIALGKAPLGTSAAPEPISTSTNDPEPITETVENTVTIVPSSELDTDESLTTSSSSSSSSSTPTGTPTTVTQDGVVQTVTVMPALPTTPANSDSPDKQSESSSTISPGAIAGITVCVVGLFVIAAVTGFFYWRRRRQHRGAQEYDDGPSSQRNSGAGILSIGRSEMTEAGSGGHNDSVAGVGSLLAVPGMDLVDPRMDPYKGGLYVRSKSHESINTVRDDHDYSRPIQPRVLRATNPDPDGID